MASMQKTEKAFGPKDSAICLKLALVAEGKGQTEKALSYCGDALEIDPKNSEALALQAKLRGGKPGR